MEVFHSVLCSVKATLNVHCSEITQLETTNGKIYKCEKTETVTGLTSHLHIILKQRTSTVRKVILMAQFI